MVVAEGALYVLAVHLSDYVELGMLDAHQLAAGDLRRHHEIVCQLISGNGKPEPRFSLATKQRVQERKVF